MSPLYLLWFGWLFSALCWAAAWAYGGNPKQRRATRLDYANRLALMVGVVLLLGLHPGYLERYLWLWHTSDSQAWIETLVAYLGFALAWWSYGAMGKKARRRIARNGPYRIVRHPMFLGIIIAGFAHAAVRGTFDAFLGAILMALGWYWRAQVEEDTLREELGPGAYDAYASRTAMFIPFIW